MDDFNKIEYKSNQEIVKSILSSVKEYGLDEVKMIIKGNINLDNINQVLTEFDKIVKNEILDSDDIDYVFNLLKEIQSPLDINLFIDKEPYIKKLSDDNVINLTGQTGSGKSTYAREHFNGDNYLVIDTDEIFSEDRFINSSGINRELGEYFRNKYETLPNCGEDFDLIYKEILDYCKNYNKTIVIDCAQFHCIKDINLLIGTLIVIRTCIDTCYERTIERFKRNNIDASDEELDRYKEKKKAIYKWYKFTNKFIEKIDCIL